MFIFLICVLGGTHCGLISSKNFYGVLLRKSLRWAQFDEENNIRLDDFAWRDYKQLTKCLPAAHCMQQRKVGRWTKRKEVTNIWGIWIIPATKLDLREGTGLQCAGWICVWHIQQQLLKVQLLPDDTMGLRKLNVWAWGISAGGKQNWAAGE